MPNIATIIPNFCDKCGVKHTKEDLEILANEGEKFFCRINCSNCSNTYLIQVTATLGPNGLTLSGQKSSIVSDLTAEEFKKFSGKQPVESSDLLDVYKKLKSVKVKSDLEKLFNS